MLIAITQKITPPNSDITIEYTAIRGVISMAFSTQTSPNMYREITLTICSKIEETAGTKVFFRPK